MPWLLDTPLETANEVKILFQMHDSREGILQVEFDYGNTVSGVWETLDPKPPGTILSYSIEEAEYTSLVADHDSLAGEKTYAAVKRGLYEHLATQGVFGSGSIT